MKGTALVALALIGIGLYIEYQKDSSFASVDSGSLLMGGGVGFLIGCYI